MCCKSGPYLQSRYYDPQVGRFINVDALAIPTSGGSIAAAADVAGGKALEAGMIHFIIEVLSK